MILNLILLASLRPNEVTHLYVSRGTTGLVVDREVNGTAVKLSDPDFANHDVNLLEEDELTSSKSVNLPSHYGHSGLRLLGPAHLRLGEKFGAGFFLVGVTLVDGVIIHYGAPDVDGTFLSDGWTITANAGSITYLKADDRAKGPTDLVLVAVQGDAIIEKDNGEWYANRTNYVFVSNGDASDGDPKYSKVLIDMYKLSPF